MDHYELTDIKKELGGHVLYRIRATKDIVICGICTARAGDLGGWIEGTKNLSGNAWVAEDALVYGNALVYDDALVYGNAQVYDDALVCDRAKVCGNALVYDNALVADDARVYGAARVYNNAQIYGNALVYGYAQVSGDAKIENRDNIMVIGPLGSRYGFTTFFKSEKGIDVACGCFRGTLDQFRDKVRERHGDNKFAKTYLAAADLAEMKIETNLKESSVDASY